MKIRIFLKIKSEFSMNFPVSVFCEMHLKDQMLFCDRESTRKVFIFLITSMYLCSSKKKSHSLLGKLSLISTSLNFVVFLSLVLLKFIYSEKATKFCEIFTLLLSYVVPVKSKVKISQNFGPSQN